jgi:hypothetical protein
MKTLMRTITLIILLLGIWLAPGLASAHCDTLDGPVITAARAALQKGDVTPVLKWVRKENEGEIAAWFNKTLVVRSKGKEAQEMADMYFFETLVRVHREGEGAPYTGLKPAGSVEHSVAAADKALESGSADNLIKLMAGAVEKGIRERYERVMEAKKHADHNVEAGRAFVAAYVEFTHYVERLHLDSVSRGMHHESHKEGNPEGHKH